MNGLLSTRPPQFEERRLRLGRRLADVGCQVPCVFPAGWARPRNFAHSHFPFRAESHFLYLLGQHIEGAILVLWPSGRSVLYLEEVDAESALWTGPSPSMEQWASIVSIDVQPLHTLSLAECAVLPPQDEETARWLSELLDQDIEAQSGPGLSGMNALLAQAVVDERIVKDEAALVQMAAVANISSEAHIAGMRMARSARTEAEVRSAIEARISAQGLGTAYNSIVTTRGDILHAERSNGVLKLGDLMLCDVGAESLEGFAADITRTWPVSGRFSPTQHALYQVVLDVQKLAISNAKAGVHYAQLHNSAVRQMGEALLDLGILRGSIDSCLETGTVSVFFPHGLGHLLGLDVHDMEDLGDRAGYDAESQRKNDPILRFLRLSRVLEENMVVTIEPGFYQIPSLIKRAKTDPVQSAHINWNCLAQFEDVRGIRIEDDVVIKTENSIVLSSGAPKEIEAIYEVMSEKVLTS